MPMRRLDDHSAARDVVEETLELSCLFPDMHLQGRRWLDTLERDL
jgi:hypothetical protein